MEDDTFIRDEEQEEMVQKMIYESARGPEPNGELDGDDDDFGSQFLNDVGEGLESEERRDNEVSLTNSGEVYIYISRLCSSLDALIYLYYTY
jgi:hypothetical protein